METEVQQNNKRAYIEEETYAKFPRAWKIDYMQGKISLNELIVLILLTWEANPYNGLITTNYDKIATYFLKGYFKDGKNGVNKIMLRLMDKEYIYYPKHKGSRRGFEVKIGGYLLSNGSTKDISHHFSNNKNEVKPKENIGEAEVGQKIRESYVDQENSGQRSKYKNYHSITEHLPRMKETESRGTNKDKDNNKNNNLSITIKKEEEELLEEISPDVANYTPKSDWEERCREIAVGLGELSMDFILSCLRKYGIIKIEEAYEKTMTRVRNGDLEGNRGDYFNSIIKTL